MSVSVSASGWINIEFDHQETSAAKIYKYLNKIGLNVISPDLKTISEHKHAHASKKRIEKKEDHDHEEHKDAEHK